MNFNAFYTINCSNKQTPLKKNSTTKQSNCKFSPIKMLLKRINNVLAINIKGKNPSKRNSSQMNQGIQEYPNIIKGNKCPLAFHKEDLAGSKKGQTIVPIGQFINDSKCEKLMKINERNQEMSINSTLKYRKHEEHKGSDSKNHFIKIIAQQDHSKNNFKYKNITSDAKNSSSNKLEIVLPKEYSKLIIEQFNIKRDNKNVRSSKSEDNSSHKANQNVRESSDSVLIESLDKSLKITDKNVKINEKIRSKDCKPKNELLKPSPFSELIDNSMSEYFGTYTHNSNNKNDNEESFNSSLSKKSPRNSNNLVTKNLVIKGALKNHELRKARIFPKTNKDLDFE